MDKDSQRNHIRKILDKLNERYRHNVAISTALKLQESSIWEKIRCLLCYLSFGNELDMDSLIEQAIKAGKEVFVPRVNGDHIDFLEINSPIQPRNKSLDIREPSAEARRWDGKLEEKMSVAVLVPGLCFTLQGHRLGRGGGYYDKFITQCREAARQSSTPPPLFLGTCYREQLVGTIDMKEHDQTMDGILSGNELYIPGRDKI